MSKYEFMIKGTFESVDAEGNPFEPASGPTDAQDVLDAVTSVFDDTDISIYDEDNNDEVFVNVTVLEESCEALEEQPS